MMYPCWKDPRVSTVILPESPRRIIWTTLKTKNQAEIFNIDSDDDHSIKH